MQLDVHSSLFVTRLAPRLGNRAFHLVIAFFIHLLQKVHQTFVGIFLFIQLRRHPAETQLILPESTRLNICKVQRANVDRFIYFTNRPFNTRLVLRLSLVIYQFQDWTYGTFALLFLFLYYIYILILWLSILH